MIHSPELLQDVLTENDVLEAARLFQDIPHIQRTPVQEAPWLSQMVGGDVFIKREDLQPNRSFKLRGPFYALHKLTDSQREKGVVCASAGNHAQGVAMACAHFGVHGTIFMPAKAPQPKVEATRRFGGAWVEIVLTGENFDEAREASQRYCQETQASYIHPFDQKEILSGAATVAHETFEQVRELMDGKAPDYLIAPVGGGGLVAASLEAARLFSPHTTVLGAEASTSDSMRQSMKAGRRVVLDFVGSFADGVAVKQVGELPFQIARAAKLHVITAREVTIAHHLEEFRKKEDAQLEPSGVLSVAVLKREMARFKGRIIVCLITGANIDNDRIAQSRRMQARFLSKEADFTVDGGDESELRRFLCTSKFKVTVDRFRTEDGKFVFRATGESINQIPALKNFLRKKGFTVETHHIVEETPENMWQR